MKWNYIGLGHHVVTYIVVPNEMLTLMYLYLYEPYIAAQSVSEPSCHSLINPHIVLPSPCLSRVIMSSSILAEVQYQKYLLTKENVLNCKIFNLWRFSLAMCLRGSSKGQFLWLRRTKYCGHLTRNWFAQKSTSFVPELDKLLPPLNCDLFFWGIWRILKSENLKCGFKTC